MDPYQHIKAKYPGEVGDLARVLPTLDALDTFRVANDLHWLLGEVERLREGRHAPPDNPRPLRDFVGILPAPPPEE